MANPSFEEPTTTDSKIGNWLVSGWGPWDQESGGVVASDGSTMLYTNHAAGVAVQLLSETRIAAGKYVFSVDVNCPAYGANSTTVWPRGIQLAVFAIPLAEQHEPRHTLIARETLEAEALGDEEVWRTLKVHVDILADSPLIGQFFQMNIISLDGPPGDPEPAQILIDNVQAAVVD